VQWRTGATFTHDWFALALVVLVVGHICFAAAHPGALRSMVTGSVTPQWVRRHAPGWKVEGEKPSPLDRPDNPVQQPKGAPTK
jgi:formate dehydrogenase subunit gamma